jgi:hypothetical protein
MKAPLLISTIICTPLRDNASNLASGAESGINSETKLRQIINGTSTLKYNLA